MNLLGHSDADWAALRTRLAHAEEIARVAARQAIELDKDNDRLEAQLAGAVSPDSELLAFVRDFADWHTTADLNALAPRARDLLDRFGGQ